MAKNPEDTFSLEIFEGPLGFLLHLIQKNEIPIHDISISEITRQYQEKIQKLASISVDFGAEFIGTAALLLLIKSRHLLPKQDSQEGEEKDFEANVEIMQQILEYCYFKEAAKDLALREEKQSFFFHRGVSCQPQATKQFLGIEHLSMEDLEAAFKGVLQKGKSQNQTVREEKWRVSDKIQSLQEILKERAKIPFHLFFSDGMLKPELVVNFLALLELMKSGGCFVARLNESSQLWIFKGSYVVQAHG